MGGLKISILFEKELVHAGQHLRGEFRKKNIVPYGTEIPCVVSKLTPHPTRL
jgi:hypothetical protein